MLNIEEQRKNQTNLLELSRSLTTNGQENEEEFKLLALTHVQLELLSILSSTRSNNRQKMYENYYVLQQNSLKSILTKRFNPEFGEKLAEILLPTLPRLNAPTRQAAPPRLSTTNTVRLFPNTFPSFQVNETVYPKNSFFQPLKRKLETSSPSSPNKKLKPEQPNQEDLDELWKSLQSLNPITKEKEGPDKKLTPFSM